MFPFPTPSPNPFPAEGALSSQTFLRIVFPRTAEFYTLYSFAGTFLNKLRRNCLCPWVYHKKSSEGAQVTRDRPIVIRLYICVEH